MNPSLHYTIEKQRGWSMTLLLMWRTDIAGFCLLAAHQADPGQPWGELQTSLFFVLVLFCLPLPFLCSACVSQPNWQLRSFLNCTQVKLEVCFHSTVMLTYAWNEMKYQNVFTAHRRCASAPKLCCLQQLGVSIRTGCVVTGSSVKAER